MRLNKFMIFSLITLILLEAVLLGCTKDEESKDDLKIVEAKQLAEKYIKEGYKDIDTVSFTGNETNPMGILVLEGYINGDKSKTFSLDYDHGQKDIIGGLVLAESK